MHGKTIFIAITLFAVIGGSTILYNVLKDEVQKPELFSVQSTQSDAETVSQEGENDGRIHAPDFTVIDAYGNSVKLSDMKGKPIVLNFWASWCPPCKAEMPEFNKVYEELKEDVHFMMVDLVDGSRETTEKGAAYIAEQGFTFPVYYDTEQEAAIQYGIRSIPTSIFIDSNGYIITGVEGSINEASLRKGIEMTIEKTEMSEYHKISVEEAKRIIDSGEPSIVLDVRTDAEYKEEHIEGAILLPDYEIAVRVEKEILDKDALILIYCRSGRRSAVVSEKLVNMGYTKVYDFGGIIDWPYDKVSE